MDMILFASALTLLALLLLPDACAQAAREALTVWGLEVAPSLFPYMVLCRALSARLSSSRLPAHRVAALLGLLGGSPAGAAGVCACARKSRLTRGDLLGMAALTGTLSPMFLLNTVRVWTGDARLCRLLAASHALGALFAFAVVRLYKGRDGMPLPSERGEEREARASAPIAESVTAMLNVGGCIVFFSVAARAVTALLPGLPEQAAAVFHAALEAAGGMRALCAAPFSPPVRAVLLAAASGFTGLSVLTQNLLFYRPLGLDLRRLLPLALLRAAGCAAAMTGLLTLFPV